MNIAISGSRDFNGDRLPNINCYLAALNDQPAMEWVNFNILCGDARGIDAAARRMEGATEFHADWKAHGKSAGPRRNSKMIKQADALIAYPSETSKGTWDAINKANKKRIPVIIHPLKQLELL